MNEDKMDDYSEVTAVIEDRNSRVLKLKAKFKLIIILL